MRAATNSDAELTRLLPLAIAGQRLAKEVDLLTLVHPFVQLIWYSGIRIREYGQPPARYRRRLQAGA